MVINEIELRIPEPEPPGASTQNFRPAGFWRRCLAWLVDMLVLAGAGYTLGIFGYEQLVGIGPYGRVIGIAAMLLYFGPLNSELAGGRTVGKRLLGITVLGMDGRRISLLRSTVRASLVTAPYSFSGWALPMFVHHPVAAWCQEVIVVGLGGSIVYTMIFNRRTRQGFHDVLCRTYVGQPTGASALPVPPLPSVHLVTAGLLLAMSVLSPVLGPILGPARWFGINMAPLEDLYGRLSNEPAVFSVAVNHNVIYGLGPTRQILTIQAWYAGIPTIEERQELIERFGRLAVTEYGRIQEVTDLVIVISTAYDLGIASWTNSYRDSRPTEEWRKRITVTSS